MLFNIAIHERRPTTAPRTAADTSPPTATLAIPGGGGNRKDDRIVFSARFSEPRLIPAAGHVVLNFLGRKADAFDYAGSIPTVRAKTIGAESSAGGRPATPTEIEASYGALPAVKWVQLNADAPFVVQLQLQKMPLVAAHCDSETGAFYVYGVVRAVVQAAPEALEDDRDRALMI